MDLPIAIVRLVGMTSALAPALFGMPGRGPVTIDVVANREPLAKVLARVARQSGRRVVLRGVPPTEVTASLHGVPLQVALRALARSASSSGRELAFTIRDKEILIYPKSAAPAKKPR